MRRRVSAESPGNAGFTLIEVLIVVAIVGIITAAAIPLYGNALRQSRSAALTADVKVVYDAMMRYHVDKGTFPSEDDFDTVTLAPLTSLGYYGAPHALTDKLLGNEIMLYLAPDVGGDDQHFILITQHRQDPGIIVVAVHTNIIEETGGWVDGVFVISGEDLEEVDL